MNNQHILQVTLCDANAVWAEKETDTDEYNLRSSTSVVINPGCTAMIPTGVEIGLPVGIFGVISSSSETFDVVSAQVKGGTAPRAILVKVRNSNKHSGLHVHVGDVIAFIRLFMEYKVHVSAKPFYAPPIHNSLPDTIIPTSEDDLIEEFNEFSMLSSNTRLPIFEKIAPSY